MEKIAQSIGSWYKQSFLGGYISPEFFVLLVSMLPLIELRGGVIIGRFLGLPMMTTIIFSAIGNIIPIPFILLFIKKIFEWLRPTKHLGKIVRKLEDKAMNKSSALDKGEFIGLVLFVGIPLPGTGAWTGALIASLLGIDIKKSSLAILLGICMAMIIMCFTFYGILG